MFLYGSIDVISLRTLQRSILEEETLEDKIKSILSRHTSGIAVADDEFSPRIYVYILYIFKGCLCVTANFIDA